MYTFGKRDSYKHQNHTPTATTVTATTLCMHIHPIRQCLRFQEFGIPHFNYDENTSARKFETFVSRVVQITKERTFLDDRKNARGDIKKIGREGGRESTMATMFLILVAGGEGRTRITTTITEYIRTHCSELAKGM